MAPSSTITAIASLFLTVTAASAARADPLVTADPASVQSALMANGYQAAISKDEDGDPKISSGAGGAKFTIFFFGCTNHIKCTSIEFYAGFTGTKMVASDMNDWNRTKRFSRAYIDKVGDPCVELDLDLDSGGISRALFDTNMTTWSAVLGAFSAKVYGH